MRSGQTKRFLQIALVWVLGAVACGGEQLLPFTGQVRVAPAQHMAQQVAPTTERAPTIRIASYNIQNFEAGRSESRRTREIAHRQADLAAAILSEIHADLILLQEMEGPEMLGLLNSKLASPHPVGYVTALQTARGHLIRLNLAVLSRHPVREAVTIDFGTLEGPGRPTRGLLRFLVELDDETRMLVYNVHLKSNWGERQRNISQRYQALMLLQEDLARQRAAGFDGIVLIAGDWNFDPTRPAFQDEPALKVLEPFKDLWRGVPEKQRITIPMRKGKPNLVFPPVTFDRFYLQVPDTHSRWEAQPPQVLSKGVNIEDNEMRAGEDATTASDHYPIYFDLRRSAEP